MKKISCLIALLISTCFASTTFPQNQQNNQNLVSTYQKDAEHGDAAAQYRLATMYILGSGVAQDKTKAIYWFQKSAEQNNASAQYMLGIAYSMGDGVKQNKAKAAYWYTRSSAQGNSNAQLQLSAFYFRGDVVPQSYKKGKQLLISAANQNNKIAQYYLTTIAFGDDDFNEAVKNYTRDANKGVAEAQYDLGLLYLNGYGVKQDDKLAYQWIQKAADQGNQHAINVIENMNISEQRSLK